MSSYSKLAIRLLSRFIEPNLKYFSSLKTDIKKSGLRQTLIEYLSTSLLTCIILFVVELPLLSLILSLLKLGPLFSLVMATTLSFLICILFFLFFLNYPKFIIRDKNKSIERTLPFATIYLSTVASSGLPPHRVFEIFSEFKEHEEISEESKKIVTDMKAFGLNIYEALNRAIDRTPSIELRDLFWSIISVLKSGGNLSIFLREKSITYLNNYRRRLNEFAKSLAIYIEIYLTLLILGAIFFTILTSIITGLGGVSSSGIVLMQFFIIFIFIPLVTLGFIIIIKSASPGGE